MYSELFVLWKMSKNKVCVSLKQGICPMPNMVQAVLISKERAVEERERLD